MSIYGKRKVLFKTSVTGDRLVVDVLTDNKEFLSFLRDNVTDGPYLVRWYKEKQDEFEAFRKYGSAFQVYSRAHSNFGLLIKDHMKYFGQNKVEYRGVNTRRKDGKLSIQKGERLLGERQGNKLFLEKDIKKAIAAAKMLYSQFYESRDGIFGRKQMPEGILPGSVEKSSYKHLMFVTLTVSIDYRRDAPELWKVSRRTIESRDTLWIYSPEEVLRRTDEELIGALQKHGLSRKRVKDSLEIWKPVCRSFYELFDSDPRNLLEECNYDALKVFKSMKLEYKKYFPYLSGRKILPLWIRMMNDVVGIDLKNLEKVPIPIDVHVARATLCLGCLKGKYVGSIEGISMEIGKAWENACECLPYYRLQLDEPLWNLSKYGCAKRHGDYCINSTRCPASQYCISGRVYVSKDRVEIDT